MDEELREIPDTDQLWGLQRPLWKEDSGKEETIGKYGVGESNAAGDNFVALAMCHNVSEEHLL